MAEEVGVAFVRLIPSMRGFADAAGDAMNDAASGPARNAGDTAGATFGGSFGSAFKGGLAGLALGAGAALVAGMGEALDQGKITSRLGAQLGATPDVAKEYGEIAGRLYSNAVTEDFQAAADTIQATMRNGLLPPDATLGQVEEMSTALADVANLMEEDVGQTARAVGQMIRTGLAEDGTEALDILTRGVQTGGNAAEDLLDTFSEYSTQFRNMGLSGEQAMGLISQGLQGGARDADVVADTIKEFSIEAVAGGERVRGGFESLGLSADDMVDKFAAGGPEAAAALDTILDSLRGIDDEATRNAVAIELFGTKAEDMGDALYALDPSSAVDALGQVGGAASEMGDTLRDNAGVQLEQFKRRLTQGFVELLGGQVIPRLGELKALAGPVFDGMGTAVESFWTTAGPALSDMAILTRDVAAAFRGLQTDTDSSMAGMGASVSEGMANVGSLMQSGADTARATWDTFGGALTQNTADHLGILKRQFRGSMDTIQGIMLMAQGIMNADWRTFARGFRQTISGAWSFATARTDWATDLIGRGWSRLWRWVADDTREWLGRMRDRISGGLSGVREKFRGLRRWFSDFFSGAPNWLVSAGEAIIDGLARGLDNATGGLLGKVAGIANSVRGFWPNSPAKEGPLRQFPPERSGALIGEYLADGLRSSVGGIADASRLAAGAAVQMPTGAGMYHTGPGSAAAPAPVLRFVSDGSRASRALMAILQESVRLDYGGSVTAAFTPRR